MIAYPQLKELPEDYIRSKINEFLSEDMPESDKTTEGIYKGSNPIKAYIQAEEETVLSGCNTIPYFFDGCNCDVFYKDGSIVQKDEIIALISGDASDILKRERAFLNLFQRMCGIASMTSKYAAIAKLHNVKILDTRKTTPGLRLFEKYSVCNGGGFNHRLDLSSGILIKDNHIEAAGSIKKAISTIKEMNFSMPVELETENEEQIIEAMKYGVDGFLLDNMNRDETISAVKLIRGYPGGEDIFIESSGGITLNNLKDYVDTGINAISIGALTHSVKAAEIHMEFERQ